MIQEPIAFAVLGFMTLITSIVFHELGHRYAFSRLGKQVPILFYKRIVDKKMILVTGDNSDYKGLSRAELRKIYAYGIATGLIPIAAAFLAMNLLGILIFPYLFGCRKDFMNLLRA